MFYRNLKKFSTLWKFLTRSKDYLIKLFRLKDVLMMMILFHVWPEQTYRFSTRKYLPCKKNRFPKESRPVIPYDLLKSKSSNIPLMKEINLVGIGSSFDLNNLKNLEGPIFFISSWSPLRMDANGKVFYRHIYSKEKAKFMDVEKLFNDQTSKEYKKNNVTYINGRKRVIEMFKKNGNNVLSVYPYAIDKDGNHYPVDKDWETPSFLSMFDHDQHKLIAIAEKIYQPPLLAPYSHWAPAKSFLPCLCALSFFTKKINVYGWDYYLDSSPENMSYWQLFHKMYQYKFDLRAKEHFESALINFYYGYQLSKLPNFKIHGYMGKLGKHHRLIKRIERILFN